MLSVGQILDGRYEVVAPIAAGGMGAVFRARRLLLGDDVAIKVIRPDEVTLDSRERFMRESRACARLRHPNIVSILDFDVDPDGHPFLVMELLSGHSLKDEIAAGPMAITEVEDILTSICQALHLAHASGIVHRDLKPANIIAHEFAPGERVHKIVDFGVAVVRESTDATRLTAAHEFIGTVAYASPEQLTGAPVDGRSDVYSLGVVAFEMLTGHVPFEGNDVLSVVTRHLTTAAPRVTAFRPDVPACLDEAIARALAKSPDDRWQSVAEFGSAVSSGASTRRTPVAPLAGTMPGGVYAIGERVGPGRLGSEVFRGVHRALGHPVAIRVLRRTNQSNWNGVRARFLREAKTLQIAHPSIIQVRDYAEEPDAVYVVTDFIEGSSLREAMSAAGPMAWDRLRPLLAQLLQAARVLHRREGLLCGLTPDMIRVTPAGDEEGERLMISTAGIWQAPDLLATLHESTLRGLGLADDELRYVAPELLTGQAADVRSDIFTIGVLAYEMATGALPYDGKSMPELLGAMLRGSPADPRSTQPSLPEATAAALLTALRPIPGDRHRDAQEFAKTALKERRA